MDEVEFAPGRAPDDVSDKLCLDAMFVVRVDIFVSLV
jgi:hypothetical protein